MKVLAILALAGSVASADPEPKPEPYRAMIIGGDVFATVFTFGGSALAYRGRSCQCEDFSGELAVFGLMAYVSVGGMVHHEAGRGDLAFVSVFERIAIPLATGLIAHRLGATTNESLLAAGAGMLGAMAIDWFALAGDTYVPEPKVSVYAAPLPGGMIAGMTLR